MKRNQLIRIVSDAAAVHGYEPHCGEPEKIGSTVRNYPAAWLAEPAVVATTGRNEGIITYAVTLHLMGLYGSVTAEKLEADAISVAASICDNPEIFHKSGSRGLSISSARSSLTAHDEISATISGEISMGFYL